MAERQRQNDMASGLNAPASKETAFSARSEQRNETAWEQIVREHKENGNTPCLEELDELPLFLLPQELQDEIQEFALCDIHKFDHEQYEPAIITALSTCKSAQQEDYPRKLAFYWKNATFEVPRRLADTLLAKAGPHAKDLKELRITVSPKRSFGWAVQVAKSTAKSPIIWNSINYTPFIGHDSQLAAILKKEDAKSQAVLASLSLDKLAKTYGARREALKALITVVDGEEVVWEVWASNMIEGVKEAQRVAGYPEGLGLRA